MTFCRHACGGKFTRAGAIISNGLLDSHTVCPLFLQFREQPGELAEVTQLGVWTEGVFSARRGENENQRAIEALLLQSEFAWPLRTRIAKAAPLWRVGFRSPLDERKKRPRSKHPAALLPPTRQAAHEIAERADKRCGCRANRLK